MMIIMHTYATQEQIDSVVEIVKANGLRAHLSTGEERTIIGAIGDGRVVDKEQFLYLPGVDRVVPISRPYKLASREFSPSNTIFPIDGVGIGGDQVLIIAGPCSVESREQLLEIAHAVQRGRRARPARRGVQAAHLALLPSRGWARRGWSCWRRRAKRRACPS